ncbi:MAG: Crp/Fnr family transcriptional regulator [Spirochaetes bacterium]|nr:Crp/Fnr family transcriptional regulator [Spirochaetota bacterium]
MIEKLKKHLTALKLDEQVISDLLRLFREKKYRKDQYYSVAGRSFPRLGFIAEGLLYLYKVDDDGKYTVVDFKWENHFFLESFDPEGQSAVNVKTLANTIVLEADYQQIELLYKKYPDLSALARKDSKKRLKDIYARLEFFTSNEAGKRYAGFLNDYHDIAGQIPQYLIASFLGITPTQLSRIRKNVNF